MAAKHSRKTKGHSRRTGEVHVASTHPHSVPIIAEEESGSVLDQPFAEGAQDAIDADLRHRLISEAAYHRYAERGFADGYDLDDWLQAEAEVDHLLLDQPARHQPDGGL